MFQTSGRMEKTTYGGGEKPVELELTTSRKETLYKVGLFRTEERFRELTRSNSLPLSRKSSFFINKKFTLGCKIIYYT